MSRLTSALAVVFAVLMLAQPALAKKRTSGACDLKILTNSAYGWHDIFEGTIYAMLEDPTSSVDDCDLCDFIGN